MHPVEPLQHQDPAVAQRIHAIVVLAHAQEAALLPTREAPVLNRTPESIRSSGEFFLGAFCDGALAGVLALGPDDSPQQIDIALLVVHPQQQRKGVATALLQETLRRGAGMVFCVTTGAGNAPALALYGKLGFVPYRHGAMGREGVPVTKLRRVAADAEAPDCPAAG